MRCTGPMAGHYNRQMAQLEALLHSKSNQVRIYPSMRLPTCTANCCWSQSALQRQ